MICGQPSALWTAKGPVDDRTKSVILCVRGCSDSHKHTRSCLLRPESAYFGCLDGSLGLARRAGRRRRGGAGLARRRGRGARRILAGRGGLARLGLARLGVARLGLARLGLGLRATVVAGARARGRAGPGLGAGVRAVEAGALEDDTDCGEELAELALA